MALTQGRDGSKAWRGSGVSVYREHRPLAGAPLVRLNPSAFRPAPAGHSSHQTGKKMMMRYFHVSHDYCISLNKSRKQEYHPTSPSIAPCKPCSHGPPAACPRLFCMAHTQAHQTQVSWQPITGIYAHLHHQHTCRHPHAAQRSCVTTLAQGGGHVSS